MKLPIHQVDAFASAVFRGNPAAAIPLESWLPDPVLQAIAMENNLAETAYFVPAEGGFHLRWFTPAIEVDLCGHATLASAWVLFERLGHAAGRISFQTRSGILNVDRGEPRLWMDFPAIPLEPAEPPAALIEGLGMRPQQVLGAMDYCCVYESEEEIRALRPNFLRLETVRDRRGIIVTAPGRDVDFVSRFFAPAAGISEDPVCGSAHCALTPYWAARLGKRKLEARQLSARGGELSCEAAGGRVRIGGACVPYLEGTISI
jgi:PhzF family phenazine biosynthesis protein